MMNIIRADIYRIMRGKGLYITLLIVLGAIIMQSAGGGQLVTGIDYDAVVLMQNPENLENMQLQDYFERPTGAHAPFRAMASASNIVYFLLPLLCFIGVVDFSSGAVKNTLAKGVSRVKYYGAKLILTCACCAMLHLAYVLIFTIVATIVSGFGGAFDGEFIFNVARTFLAQLLVLLAVACVGNFLVFLMRSAAVIGVYIAFALVPIIVIMLLTVFDDWFLRLFNYELTTTIGMMNHIGTLPSREIAMGLLVAAGYMLAATAGGYLLLRRAEVK